MKEYEIFIETMNPAVAQNMPNRKSSKPKLKARKLISKSMRNILFLRLLKMRMEIPLLRQGIRMGI